MWGLWKASRKASRKTKEKKMKAKRFRVIDNKKLLHYFKVGTLVKKISEINDGKYCICIGKLDNGKIDLQTVYPSQLEEITEKPSILHRLYIAIIGALFGPESHSRNRY